MAEVARELPGQEILDAVELAFRGLEFEPLAPVEECEVLPASPFAMGSMRVRYCYDPVANCFVHGAEFVALVQSEDRTGALEEEHRLIVWWDNGASEEVDLDTGKVILDDEDVKLGKTEIEAGRLTMQGLRALMSDV